MRTSRELPPRPGAAERMAGALQLSRRTVWFLSFGVAALLLAALVVFVVHEQRTANQAAPYLNAKAEEQANQESETVVRQDQAPHTLALAPGLAPVEGARHAVLAYMGTQINQASISGPIESSSCHEGPGWAPSRRAYTCGVTADNVLYPFDVVVSPASHLITYCKHDEYAILNMRIPLSPSCLGNR